jgi:hypothetical protein
MSRFASMKPLDEIVGHRGVYGAVSGLCGNEPPDVD